MSGVQQALPENTSKDPIHPLVLAVIIAAKHYGRELDPEEFTLAAGEEKPTVAALSTWLQEEGLWSKALRMKWSHLMNLGDTGPIVLVFSDGAGILTGVDPVRKVVFIKNPAAPNAEPVAIEELRLTEVWTGDAILLRTERTSVEKEPPFNLSWMASLVLKERKSLMDIAFASIMLSVLTIFPPLIVMSVVDKVLTHNSFTTLELLASILVIGAIHETFLGHARRLIVVTVGTKLDARLNLHVFNKLLRLPLNYFERHPSGETMHKIGQIYKVRDFLTGKLLTTMLDLMTLFVLLPFLFYLNATLAWIILGCSVLIALIIAAFLLPLRKVFSRVVRAETDKASVLGETVYGVKTVKSLALEPQRKMLWDIKVAEAGKARLDFGRISNWPQTLVNPIERFMNSGIVLIGAWMALYDTTGFVVGALFAFMMLSARVAQPLVGLARLIEDYEQVGSAINEAASVLNRPLESNPASGGLRPQFEGAINFQDITFTYPGSMFPALEKVSFSVPAGTMLGIVGRSGSGKSTITRLLQGIERDYNGSIKIDGADLREINLRHLRKSFGVVLQENFLFRGSVRENVTAGRPGLTVEDVVWATRLAGAEEFVEKLPGGYETQIEEGSPNLSGGQRQRLAIARALISDPKLMILDEATSALDPESEALVNANLLRIAQGRTMVVVSHRLSSLVDCNLILVMDKGSVVDIAPHAVLLERCAIYRQLWNQQNRHNEPQETRHVIAAPTITRAN